MVDEIMVYFRVDKCGFVLHENGRYTDVLAPTNKLVRRIWDELQSRRARIDILTISAEYELTDCQPILDVVENFVTMVCDTGGSINVRVHKNNAEEIVESFARILKPYYRYKRGFDLEVSIHGE